MTDWTKSLPMAAFVLTLTTLCACATGPKGFWLNETKDRTSHEIDGCKKNAAELISSKGLTELQNTQKRYRERTKENSPGAGLDQIYCGPKSDLKTFTSLAYSVPGMTVNINKENCLYEAKRDRWLCIEQLSKFPKIPKDLKTSAVALNDDDRKFLDELDEKSRNRNFLETMEMLSLLTATVQTLNRLPVYDPDRQEVASTPLELIHEMVVVATYLGQMRAKDLKLYDKLVLGNANNRLAIHTFFDEAEKSYEVWRNKVKEETFRTIPGSYDGLHAHYKKLSPSVTF